MKYILKKKDLFPKMLEFVKLLRERDYSNEYMAKILCVIFGTHEIDVVSSLAKTIEYQQYVINELIDSKRKELFVKYINDCIEQGVEPHSLSITNWDEFIDEAE